MSVKLHFHRYPSCGTTCNTACDSVEGTCTTCTMVKTGPHKGEFGCIHVVGESISVEELGKLVRELIDSFEAPSEKKQEQAKLEK